MIEYIEGDIFQSPAQVIVNTVNTVGVMGKGIALAYKRRYPDMFKAYQVACDKHQLTIGKLMLWYAPDHWILLFPTKEHWRNPSKIEYIEAGLRKFTETYAQKNITSIAFPRLGCGNGELDWNDVRLIMEKYLRTLPINVYVYTRSYSDDTPEHKKQEEMMNWIRSHAKDLSFSGLKEDIQYSSSVLPIAFEHSNVQWNASWENGIKFTGSNETYISEEDIRKYWDEIRSRGIVKSNSGNVGFALLLSLLAHMHYLDAVRIQEKGDDKLFMQEGFQLLEGAGRLFVIRSEVE